MKTIPEEMKKKIQFVSRYVGTLTDDWVKVKNQIRIHLLNEHRKLLSRRHYSTKKHILNDFEKLIIEYWKELTGISLFIPENKKHDINWIQRDRGWKFKIINEERKILRNAKTQNNK